MKIKPEVSPIDFNVQFLKEDGWNQTDRLRFHLDREIPVKEDHPIAQVIERIKPHILLRRYNIEEDFFIAISLFIDGNIQLLSNEKERAKKYISNLFFDFPPSFYTAEQFDIVEEGWVEDESVYSMFLGMLTGAMSWDPLLQVPPAIEQSLEEAGKALSIANYRSCVVMCRRTIEALLKFAFRRLLGTEPVDKGGRTLSLDKMIGKFREQRPQIIPTHLINLLDSIRLIGNVPGAHAAEIEGYPFTKSDAEYALASVHYFLEQYFSKIDKEVSTYYTLTIDLNGSDSDEK
jgi:HEPN domain-containing protein